MKTMKIDCAACGCTIVPDVGAVYDAATMPSVAMMVPNAGGVMGLRIYGESREPYCSELCRDARQVEEAFE